MQELTENDFFQGLVATLAIKGVQKVSIRTENFDPVLLAVFHRLEQRAGDFGVEPDFDIIPDPIHGDSLTVRDILASAAADGLISFDNPSTRTSRSRSAHAAESCYLAMTWPTYVRCSRNSPTSLSTLTNALH